MTSLSSIIMNTSSSSIYLHCHVGSDEVVFAYSSLEPLFESLQTSIAHRFQLTDAVYRFVDADGDICRIDSEQELRDALSMSTAHDSMHIAVTPTLDTPIPHAVMHTLTASASTPTRTPTPPQSASLPAGDEVDEKASVVSADSSPPSTPDERAVIDSDDESYAEARNVRVKTTRRGGVKHSRVVKSAPVRAPTAGEPKTVSASPVGIATSTARASDNTNEITDRRVLAVDVGVVPDDHLATEAGGNIIAPNIQPTEQHDDGKHRHSGAAEIMQQLAQYVHAEQGKQEAAVEENKTPFEHDKEEKQEAAQNVRVDVSDRVMSPTRANTELSFLLSAIFSHPQIQETLTQHENEVRQWMNDRSSLVQIIDRLSVLCTDPSAAAVFAFLFHRINLHSQTTCSQCRITPIVGTRHEYQLMQADAQQQVASAHSDDDEMKSVDLSAAAATSVHLCNACYVAQADELNAVYRVVLHIDVAAPVDALPSPFAQSSSSSPRHSLHDRVIAGGRRFAKNMSVAGQRIKDTTTPIITHVYTEVKRTVNGMLNRMTTEPSQQHAASPRSARRLTRVRAARLVTIYTEELSRLRDLGLIVNEDEIHHAARLLRRFEGDIDAAANELIRLKEELQNLEAARQLEQQDVPQMINPGISA